MTAELKRKLRQLKKFEEQVRFNDSQFSKNKKYIWNQYFSTKNESDDLVKYNMQCLMRMDHQRLKEVFEEYFYYVYFQYYRDNGIFAGGFYDSDLLECLGLPYDANLESIKHRFRELAKKYHPDQGGDSNKFIDVLAVYKKLMNDK